MKWTRAAALILAISLLLTGCGLPTIRRAGSSSSQSSASSVRSTDSSAPSSAAEPTAEPTAAPDPYASSNEAWLAERDELTSGWDTFSDLEYERPDAGAIADEMSELIARAADETDAASFFESYDKINDDYKHYVTMSTLLSIRHDLDVNDDDIADELTLLSESFTEVNSLVGDMYTAIYDNPLLTEWCESNWTAATVRYTKSLCGYIEDDETTVEETNLLLEYDRLEANFSVQVGDESWTYSDFLAYDFSGPVSYDEFYEYYDQYEQEYNAAAGELFLRLRDLRVKEAESAGYDSYADYMYESYGCDYGSADLDGFCEAMKTYIAPLFEQLYWDLYTDDSVSLYAEVYSADDTLETFGEVLSEISPRLYDSYKLMISHELYDIEPSASKASGGYTTFLYDYGVPFILASFSGSYQDVSTVIHEFGHFSSMAREQRCRLEEVDSIDLAEIDSQGLELLMFPYYDRLFGDDLADAARSEVLLSAMYSLLSGCMEDEFQRRIYADPDMTLDEMNSLYSQLADEYGMTETYGTTGYYWTMVSHTFSSPMYYISYALSMVSAMELWVESQDDWSEAFEKYQDFIDERGYNYSYREALGVFDFDDPLTESDELIGEIAEQLEQYAYSYYTNGEAA